MFNMLKKFFAIILVISISTLCAAAFCFAECDVDKLEMNTFGINECSGTYDINLYLSRDTIKELCPPNTLHARGKVQDFAKTVWDKCSTNTKLSRNACKGLTISAAIVAGLGATAATIGAIGMHFQTKGDMIGPDAPGRRSVSSDEDFCDNLLDVFKKSENCGAIINFQKQILSDRVIFSDMNITSQK